MKKRIVCITILLLVLIIAFGFADEYELRDTVVLVLIQSRDIAEDLYRDVIVETVKIELESARLQVRAGTEIVDINDQEAASEIAEKANADFIISGIYSVRGRLLEIDFIWYDVQFQKISESVSERIVMDLTFDESISEIINEIIILMNERIREFPLVIIQEPEILEEEDVSDIQENTEIIEDLEENDNISSEVNIIDNNLEIVNLPEPEKSNYIEASAGFSPFICIGRAHEYFKIGFLPSIYVNYVFNLDFGKLGIGLFAGINSFNVEDQSPENHFLVPVGANFRYTTASESRFNFFARISSGPAIFIVNFNNETLSKIIFYILGGAGLDIRITEIFGLAIEAGYFIFFEEEDPVMGFTPGVYCYFRI